MDVLKYANEMNHLNKYPELYKAIMYMADSSKKTLLYNIINGNIMFGKCPQHYGLESSNCDMSCRACWHDALSKVEW